MKQTEEKNPENIQETDIDEQTHRFTHSGIHRYTKPEALVYMQKTSRVEMGRDKILKKEKKKKNF